MSTVLEDKVIIVKPIKRTRAFYKKGHDGEFMFTGCFRGYGLPYDSKARSYINPFRDSEEQQEFEKLLNRKPGALSLYDYSSEFWGKDFRINLNKEDLKLNLNNPSDALWYRVFMVNPKFAKDPDDATNASREYELVDQKYESEKISKSSLRKSKAFTELNKIKKSKNQMIDTLRLLGKRPAENASPEWLESELVKIIDEPVSTSTKNKLNGVEHFLAVALDTRAPEKLFIMDAVDAGEIMINKEGYTDKETGKFLGKSLMDVIDYFASKSPEAQERKLIIKERLK